MNEIERAIAYWEEFEREIDEMPHSEILEAQREPVRTALTVLRAELEREKNEPLTIEEILDMNGKPVWCQTGDGYEGWALVIVDKYQDGGHYLYLFSDDLTRDGINECFEPDEDFINLKFSDDPDGHFGLHVLGWRAYRYKPKGEPNV